VNLACKVVAAEEAEKKKQRNRQWFEEKAKNAGLDFRDDEQLLEDIGGDSDDDPRNRGRTKEVEQARMRLQVMLTEPMQTQRFGKFLSTNSAWTQNNAVVPPIVSKPPTQQVGKGKRRKRKRR